MTLPNGMFLTADSFETTTPINLYAAIAFSNLVTTVCQYEVRLYKLTAVYPELESAWFQPLSL
jgi:hypothetical protein